MAIDLESADTRPYARPSTVAVQQIARVVPNPGWRIIWRNVPWCLSLFLNCFRRFLWIVRFRTKRNYEFESTEDRRDDHWLKIARSEWSMAESSRVTAASDNKWSVAVRVILMVFEKKIVNRFASSILGFFFRSSIKINWDSTKFGSTKPAEKQRKIIVTKLKNRNFCVGHLVRRRWRNRLFLFRRGMFYVLLASNVKLISDLRDVRADYRLLF